MFTPILRRAALVPALLALSLPVLSLAQEILVPDPNLNAAVRQALAKPAGPLTAADMLSLTNLSAIFRGITNLQGLETALNLTALDLQDNRITNVDLVTNLTRLVFLDLSENRFSKLTIPAGMIHLTALRAEFGELASLTLPEGMTRLTNLSVGFNRLPSLTLPADMTNLTLLSAYQNQLTNLALPRTLGSLIQLNLDGNQLDRLDLPAGMKRLDSLIASGNQLTTLSLPDEMTSLRFLRLNKNQLTTLSLPPDLQALVGLFAEGNALATVVLSEALAASGMANQVAFLRAQGVSVFTYPLEAQLVEPLMLAGSFKFGLTGPPGVYSILSSPDLSAWTPVGVAANPLGSVLFHEVTPNFPPQKFYRVWRQLPPENMVYLPPNTFLMGTPDNEANRQADEGPQTTVTIDHGFWIGKYEVTQREYLAVTGSNPSQFVGDLSRPVESVSWLDASNYCVLRTQQELLAGRIPPGSHYRLPTEAEWECAARAGSSTRFSYGDDPTFTSLSAHAWYSGNAGFGTHPVGQKAPNPWGLFDMEGNVVEWTSDWYGPYAGGSVTDPRGPSSNPQGAKVIRGGGWDAFPADCRSGRRLPEGVSPFIHDFILGFRVVLVAGPY